MFDSTLQLILPAKTELPITVGTFIYIIEESAIELLAKHFDTKLTRLLVLFFGTLKEVMHLGKPFSNQDEHFVLRKVHSADHTRILTKDLLALELEVALPSSKEAPKSQLKRETDGLNMLNLN